MDLIVPWRDTGDPYRRAHFWRLAAWYQSAGLGWIPADRPGVFNRAAARNAGVAASSAAVVCVIDADNLVSPRALQEAAALVGVRGGWAKPFRRFGYLSHEATDAWYAGTLDPFTTQPTWEGDGPQEGFAGGAYVMRRQDWLDLGGMDEAFTGWGAEDDAFTITATRALRPARVVGGTCYHLWHPAARITSPENYQRLMEVYVNGHKSP